ncbi:hypothetical protein WCLP8_4610003 [uncultured Gammaproteobacteria bacterium]
MLIGLFQGDFQYDAVNRFVDHLAAALNRRGIETLIIDVAAPRPQVAEAIHLLQDRSRELAGLIGFNTLGSTIVLGRHPLHRRLGVPFVSWLVDHPVFHLDRLDALADQPVLCIDPGHAHFLHRLGLTQATVALHAGAEVPTDSQSVWTKQSVWTERRGHILFAGTGGDPATLAALLRQGLTAQAPDGALVRVFDDLADQPTLSTDGAVEQALADHPAIGRPFEADEIGLESRSLLQALIRYRRVRRRHDLLRALDQAGIAVDLCGHGWGDGWFRHHRLLGPRSFTETLALFGRYRVALNINPLFAAGLHDRVVYAALAGAMVWSDSNPTLAAELGSGRGKLFSWTESDPAPRPPSPPEPNSEPNSVHTATTGRDYFRAHHSWDRRVMQILPATIGNEPGLADRIDESHRDHRVLR